MVEEIVFVVFGKKTEMFQSFWLVGASGTGGASTNKYMSKD